MLEKTLTVIAATLIIAAVAIGLYAGVGADRPSQAKQPTGPMENFRPAKFKFFRLDGDVTDISDFLLIEYEDGRKLVMRTSASAAIAYYPEPWAKAVGLPADYVEVLMGSRTFRIDIGDDPEARQFLKMVFEIRPDEVMPDIPEPKK